MSATRRFFLIALIALVSLGAAPPASWRPLTDEEIISADALRALQTDKVDFILFDARGKKSYEAAHIEGAVLPLSEDFYVQDEKFRAKETSVLPDSNLALAEATRAYPRDKRMVTYCNINCKASAALLLRLKSLGFAQVQSMEEGIQTWESKGYPLKKASA